MNAEAVAKSYDKITKSHDNEKPEDAAVPYRHYNNYIKRALISDVLKYYTQNGLRKAPPRPNAPPGPTELYVLDIASGRGGDLKKWCFQNRVGRDAGKLPVVGRIYGFDISTNCVAAASQRAEELLATAKGPVSIATYEVADTFGAAFWDDLVKRQSAGLPRFDIGSCFFAFHYGCRSADSVHAVLSGVASTLLPGGLFFGTIVDADELSKRLVGPGGIRSTKLCNSLFRVNLTGLSDEATEEEAKAFIGRLLGDGTTLPLGTNYYFHLEGHVDADEFVIPYTALCDIAATCGLRPVPSLSYPFGDKLSGWFGDKNKMNTFGNDGDLSVDERSLITLYRTFCFELQ